MTEHLLTTVIISLVCIAVNATTWRDMVFSSLADRIERWIISQVGFETGSTLCQPLFRCPMCMASFWSILAWIFSGCEFNLQLMMLTVCGLNVVLVGLIKDIIPDD